MTPIENLLIQDCEYYPFGGTRTSLGNWGHIKFLTPHPRKTILWLFSPSGTVDRYEQELLDNGGLLTHCHDSWPSGITYDQARAVLVNEGLMTE